MIGEPPSDRSLELAEIALEAAAQSVQSGASLREKATRVDPLALEYLKAAQEIAAWREDGR